MNAATLSGPNSDRSMTPAMRASRLLGWVSFGIAAAELLAPRRVARAVGLEGHETLLRAYGAREVLAGVGAHSIYPVPAMWSRVAGDLVDLGTLAYAAKRSDDRSRNAWIAIAAVAGITLIDALVAGQLAAETKEGKGEPKDYSGRSGFPGGVEAARGAGVARDAWDGAKAGGAAAGDSSPAGRSSSGRTSTDLNGGSGGFIGGDRNSTQSGETAPQSGALTPA